MKNIKRGGLYRIVLFILLACMFIAVVGIAVDGWQGNTDKQPETDTKTAADGEKTPDTQEPAPQPPAIRIPEHTNYLTGLETSASLEYRNPLAVVFRSGASGYGLARSSVTFEFPTEDGDTRFLAYITDTDNLGQIGELAPYRTYMANVLSALGGLLVAYGKDDALTYNGYDASHVLLDLKIKSGYAYTETDGTAFTNGYMLGNGLSDSTLFTSVTGNERMPFRFADFGADTVLGTASAARITLPYAAGNETSLVYDEKAGTYVLSKSGVPYFDMLDKCEVAYRNVFVLFADAATYEKTDLTQMVLDTTSGGSGYYATAGTFMRITWLTGEDGKLRFFDSSGKELTVNRGTSYISFFKSSKRANVKIG